MAKAEKICEVAIKDLRPYDKNAKVHSDEQVDMICNSIEEFGFISPCLIDKDNRIIAGHGRVMAAKKLGLKKVPCVYIEGLTEEQYKAYILVDNKLTELGGWDFDLLNSELDDIDFDMSAFGFETDALEIPAELDDTPFENNNIILTINIPSPEIYENIKDQIQSICDDYDVFISVKMN